MRSSRLVRIKACPLFSFVEQLCRSADDIFCAEGDVLVRQVRVAEICCRCIWRNAPFRIADNGIGCPPGSVMTEELKAMRDHVDEIFRKFIGRRVYVMQFPGQRKDEVGKHRAEP